MSQTPPRIAIPSPTSADLAYNRLNWSAYADAVRACGGEPVEFPLDQSPRQIAERANSCHAILLPGSPADVNPAKYGQDLQPGTAPADLQRENVDELLLQDAHNLYKPILGICFGAQIMNVWRSGTLLQELTILPVNHAASRSVGVAHTASIASESILSSIVDLTVGTNDLAKGENTNNLFRIPVNSSHHQAIGIPGDGLTVSARCSQDGVVEAIEGRRSIGTAADVPPSEQHFVLGVQWHPERTFTSSATSRKLFERLVDEASTWVPRRVLTSVVGK